MLELISEDNMKKKNSDYIKFNHPIKGDWIDTLNDTKERRKSQICRVYDVKVDKSHLNNETENQLKMLSLEAKWYCNHIRSKIQTWYKYDEKNGIYIQINKNQESLFDMDYKIDFLDFYLFGYKFHFSHHIYTRFEF